LLFKHLKVSWTIQILLFLVLSIIFLVAPRMYLCIAWNSYLIHKLLYIVVGVYAFDQLYCNMIFTTSLKESNKTNVLNQFIEKRISCFNTVQLLLTIPVSIESIN
jgi:hypothetical protein